MSLVATRERRPNAGNRMYELLQRELEVDEIFLEVDNDEDFTVNYDDDDILDSDFDQSSGHEEEDNEDAEKQILIDEKRAKKAANKKGLTQLGPVLRKRKLPEITTPPLTNSGRITSMPGANEYMVRKPIRTKKPSASTVPVLNGVRSSSRRQTVESKKILQRKLKEYERRRAQLPKREKVIVQPKTQEELLEEAKIIEAANIASLREFELREAKKIESARPFKKNFIEGPFIRDLSYIEGDDDQYRQKKLIVEVSSGEDGKNIARELSGVQWWNGADGFGDPQVNKRQAKKLFIFENFSKDEEAKIFEEWRKKPLKMKKVLCPFTGLAAKYKDPKSGIPYATVDAYKRLLRLLNHDYVWSPVLNVYVNAVDQRPATGTPVDFEPASPPQVKPKREKKPKEENPSEDKEKIYNVRERRSSFKRTG
ncbi:hypothetical protein G9A89_014817 [Geosiphon pyriformis]|nr:hypothetical protein G9A89_014817 [Geosiphon pyriformis]